MCTERPPANGVPSVAHGAAPKAGACRVQITAAQVERVQASWAHVHALGDAAGTLFYRHLFALAPHLRPLFRHDMNRQAVMLLAMLDSVVAALDRIDEVLPAARKLAIRHVAWGVKAEHYDSVGAALLATLEEGLGATFCAQTRQAWAAAYAVLASAMKEAAYP